ncbi:MAG: hypothetical protein EXQ56_13055 [Acidobacteria bacterium]|nr:hypothetical protein [Acidobacteriota bacterium]
MLTRLHKKTTLSEREVEDLVGVPVIRVFPNDYHAVQQALDSGTLLPPTSQLGTAFADLADALVARKSPTKADSYKRKFLEFVGPTA